MSDPPPVPSAPSQYGELVRRQAEAQKHLESLTPEQELDTLVNGLQERKRNAVRNGLVRTDPFQALRESMLKEFIPIFVELVEKYSESGISLQMDASSFLEGGRELRFEFGAGEHRIHLQGTVTTEAIAFHETRFSPDVQGELVSGPMLRLHNLTGEVFRDFVCRRLAVLVRAAIRQH